jgi:hypothetical protein
MESFDQLVIRKEEAAKSFNHLAIVDNAIWRDFMSEDMK